MEYPNGRNALIITEAPNHQNRYFVFDNDKKGTCLLSIDEYAIGFCICSLQKNSESAGVRVALTKVGAIVTDTKGNIVHEWKWDRTAQNRGTPPVTPIIVKLNKFFEFRLKDRYDMRLEYINQSVNKAFDVSLKHSRSDSYLDNSTKDPTGKLLPKIDYKSLKQRQKNFNEEMRAQRNKLHPKSENLSDMVRGIVTNLESDFKDIDERLLTSVNFGKKWKSNALTQTISEIPLICASGTEVGKGTGFCEKIYTGDATFRNTAPAMLMSSTGEWRDPLAIRAALREVNPTMKRSAMLGTASGRYSEVIVVDPNKVSASNPQGKVQVAGIPLETMSWRALKEDMMRCVTLANSPVFVVLLVRNCDPLGLLCENISRIVHETVTNEANNKDKLSTGLSRPSSSLGNGSARFRMVKIDVGEDNDALTELGAKTLPTFAMKHNGTLLYSGLLGGRGLKPSAQDYLKPQVLLIEPIFEQQIAAEKILKKCGCQVYLCLTAQQAIDIIRNMSVETPKCFDMILISEDIQSAEMSTLGQRLISHVKSGSTFVCGLVSSKSLSVNPQADQVRWVHHCTDDVSLVLEAPLSRSASMVMKKPLRGNAVEHMLSIRQKSDNNALSMGLTATSLYSKMLEMEAVVLGKGPRLGDTRNTQGYVGIKLAAEESVVRGTKLIR